MGRRTVSGGAANVAIEPLLDRLRVELEIPTSYGEETLAQTTQVSERDFVTASDGDRTDHRDLPFVTLDPEGSRDLDQAFFLARTPQGGYDVYYAIADVASFVDPGSALDLETHQRALTYYGPDGRFGLHPPILSEGAASLLPGVDRPAVVWRIGLNSDGVIEDDIQVYRALINSREQLTYTGVQAELDAGTASDMLQILVEVGQLRIDAQIARGGATIDVPDQEVEHDGDGYRLVFRSALACEEYNAQLSLLTGLAAARLQRAAGVGIWRTLAPARDSDISRLRKVARGLGLTWPRRMPYGAFAQEIDSSIPAHAAFATEATRLFRGAGYVAFGTPSNPEVPLGAAHSAIAAEYAHVTAPLRRLVDRYGTEIALAQFAGKPVPQWVIDALDALPATMAAGSQRANAYEKASVDLIEAVLLAPRIGEVLDAVVVESSPSREEGRQGQARATVLTSEPAIRSRIEGPLDALVLGTRVRVRVEAADPQTRSVQLSVL